jgi:microcystin-dependent protein
MGIKFTNNAIGTLASGIGTGDTTIVLTAGHGALFPTLAAGDYFYARLKKATNQNEIIKCTARSTDTLTAARAQDGTTALTFSAGDEIRLTWPRVAIADTQDEARAPKAVDTISSNTTLTSADKLKQKVVTAGAAVTLPASADLVAGEWIDFKSSTEASVTLIPAGADTLDGDGSASPYRLPSFCNCRVMKSGSGAYVLTVRPDTYVGKLELNQTNKLPKGKAWANGQALSRTTFAGLFAELVKSATVTITISSPGVVTWTAHGLIANDPVKFTTTGALPTGLTPGTTYYVRNPTANDFELAATQDGAAINTSGTQSGTHTGIYAPHGDGDGSTTFNAPDFRGRAPFGKDDMGGASAAGRLTPAGSTINGKVIGAGGGAENGNITTSHLPASGLSVPGLAFSANLSGSGNLTTDNSGASTLVGGGPFGTVAPSTFSVSGTTSGGTTGNMGSGNPYPKLNPAGICNFTVKT